MFDLTQKIGYDKGATVRTMGFFIANNLILGHNRLRPTQSTSPVPTVARRTKATANEWADFITKKNRATCQDDTRFLEKYCAMCIEHLNATIIAESIPLVNNLIGGAA